MEYSFLYYTDEYFDQIEKLILDSYSFGFPAYQYNQLQFDRGIHSAWANNKANWEQTTGLWFENQMLVAVAISMGAWQGDAFFIFDHYDRADDKMLLKKMFHHVETHMSCFKGNQPYEERTRYLKLTVPPELTKVRELAEDRGYVKAGQGSKINILPFDGTLFHYELGDGYTIADGNSVPPFYSANAHMFSFNYTLPTANNIKSGFEDLKRMKGYDPELDLVALDSEGKPVGLGIIWCNKTMQFCELEPLGVAWWCRRRGIARALIYELANRVMKKYPACQGMIGGDQQFYWDLGFLTEAENEVWKWEKRFD
jgi:ribosomal protein S18 acetylase RimI-like enzyme